mgnify:CR=1 FL=1|jgi:hypothetical protein
MARLPLPCVRLDAFLDHSQILRQMSVYFSVRNPARPGAEALKASDGNYRTKGTNEFPMDYDFQEHGPNDALHTLEPISGVQFIDDF